jgi:hypothetical protein
MPQGKGTYGSKRGRPKLDGSRIKKAAGKVKKGAKSLLNRGKAVVSKYKGKVDRKSVRGVKKTKGGNYPIYKKGSAKGKGFNSALSAARKKGQKTFTWDKRSYHTGVKKTTRKGASYTSVVGKGSRLKNMSSKMKANAAARRKKRAAKKKK